MTARDRLRKLIAACGMTGDALLEHREGIVFLCAEVDRLESLVELLARRLAQLEGDGK